MCIFKNNLKLLKKDNNMFTLYKLETKKTK